MKTLKEIILESVELEESENLAEAVKFNKSKIKIDEDSGEYDEDIVVDKGTYVDNNGINKDTLKIRVSASQTRGKFKYYISVITASRGNVLFTYKGETSGKIENFADNVEEIVDFGAEVVKQLLNAGYWIERNSRFRIY